MNKAMRATIFNFQSNYLYQSTALFHSTPVLEQKRRNFWRSGKRSRRLRGKQDLLRNLNAYADYLLQGWRDDFSFNEDDPSSSRGSSWFNKHYGKGRNDWHSRKGPQNKGRRAFEFCEDDDDVETIFRSAFGGNRFFYWSFVEDETSGWRRSFGHSNNRRNSWRFYVDEEYDSSSESEQINSELVADRLALGLSASGPLTLEDVKNAYRSSALKWHPDRHSGPSKAAAEEKFKLCSSAYQSLCDKLALN